MSVPIREIIGVAAEHAKSVTTEDTKHTEAKSILLRDLCGLCG